MHDCRDPKVPAIAKHAWESFWSIERRGRSGNGYAALPISHQEIAAWIALRGETLAPWELRLMDIMEDERLAFLNKREEAEKPAGKANAFTPITTTEQFDAFFGNTK